MVGEKGACSHRVELGTFLNRGLSLQDKSMTYLCVGLHTPIPVISSSIPTRPVHSFLFNFYQLNGSSHACL